MSGHPTPAEKIAAILDEVPDATFDAVMAMQLIRAEAQNKRWREAYWSSHAVAFIGWLGAGLALGKAFL